MRRTIYSHAHENAEEKRDILIRSKHGVFTVCVPQFRNLIPTLVGNGNKLAIATPAQVTDQV